jgi:hypothetical protein
MTTSKFILKDPSGGAYEVTMDDIQRYFKKGDIKPDWLARRNGQGAWYRVGVLLDLEEAAPLNSQGVPFEAPPARSASRALEPAASPRSTMAMFEAQPVVSAATLIHRLELMVLPVKLVCTLVGLALGALLGNGAGGRPAYLITGAILGGGLGFFAGYITALLLDSARQALVLQEKIAANNRDA